MTQQPEIIKDWHNFSQNDGSTCVDIRFLAGGLTQLRDSKDPAAGAFTFNADEWNVFVAGVKNGRADLPTG